MTQEQQRELNTIQGKDPLFGLEGWNTQDESKRQSTRDPEESPTEQRAKGPGLGSRLASSLGKLGGKAVQAAGVVSQAAGIGLKAGGKAAGVVSQAAGIGLKAGGKAAGIVGQAAGKGLKAGGKVASKVIRDSGRAAGEAITEYKEKRAATSGLREDYSVKGGVKRYWLDNDHYIVFNPSQVAERDMAQQAIQDFKLYGSVEGQAGDMNEVIEAGEQEQRSKKLTKDPLISQEFSEKMQRGGRFLADASIYPNPKRQAGYARGVDLDEDAIFDPDEEDYEPPQRRAPRPAQGSSSGSGTRRIRTPEDQNMNVRIPQVRILSDAEMFPEMNRRKPRQPDYEDEEEPRAVRQTPRRVSYSPPSIESLMPKFMTSGKKPRQQECPEDEPSCPKKPRGPVVYKIPSFKDISPIIESAGPEKKKATGPVVFKMPSFKDIAPKFIHPEMRKTGPVGPVTYRPPRINEILPRVDSGFNELTALSPRRVKPEPVVEAPAPKRKVKKEPAEPEKERSTHKTEKKGESKIDKRAPQKGPSAKSLRKK
jgi:hypothetical protein